MLAIRLARGGAKKKPYYRLVVTDSRNARDSGDIKERLGHYNPVAKKQEPMIHINLERLDAWLAVGAQPSMKAAQIIRVFRKAQAKSTAPVMRTKIKKVASVSEKSAEASTAETTEEPTKETAS